MALRMENDDIDDDEWINLTADRYHRLDESQRNDFLDRLLDSDGSFPQLLHLNKKLVVLLRLDDFVHLLPPELSELILDCLDAEILLLCCQVSRRWNDFVSQLDRVWEKECKRLGMDVETIEATRKKIEAEDGNWASGVTKRVYQRRAKLMGRMKTGSAFCRTDLHFHEKTVTAVWYFDGRIYAGCSNGLISIWDSTTCRLLRTIEANFIPTCIKSDSVVLLASSTIGTLAAWKENARQASKAAPNRLNYEQHAGSIFSFDFDLKLDLLVSGSADKIVKLWSLSSTRLLTSLRGHDRWVVKVVLGSASAFDVKRVILTMQCDVLFVWNYDSNDAACTFVTRVPIFNQVSSFFTPGLNLNGWCIAYVQQNRQTRTKHKTDLCRYDILANVVSNTWTFDFVVKMLLAIGNRYVCFVLPQKEDPNVVVLDLITLKEVATLNIPHSIQVTPNLPQICFCDDRWLNGFGFCNSGVPLIAVGLENGDICLIKWSSDEIE